VVDDNRDAADSLAVLLRILGAEVDTAYDGASALEKIRRDRPAAVFLDIGMPQMDGYEVAAQIRGAPQHQEIILVALTGWGQEEDRRRSQQAGFDHHLVKPPDLEALRAVLTSVAEPATTMVKAAS
jgi:CheY-like chemotaxis protein